MSKPKILIVPGWIDSTNVYAEYVMRHARHEFYFEKNYYENVDVDKFDLVWQLYATTGTRTEYPENKKVKIIYEGRECHGVHPDNPAVGACCKRMIEFSKDWLGREKMHELRFGIDHELFQPFDVEREDDLFHIGFVGGLTNPRKMFPEIIEPLGAIEGCKLMTSTLEGQTGMIRNWLGLPYLYNQFDVLVLGSVEEGFNFPILEAAACGVPIITTPVGIAEEFTSKGGGFLVDPVKVDGYTPTDADEIRKQIQEKIEYLRDNPEIAKEMGRKNRETVLANWTWEKRIGNFIEFFKDGLNG